VIFAIKKYKTYLESVLLIGTETGTWLILI